MNRFLRETTIAVTRPSAQAHGLVKQLEQVGAEVICVPAIEILANPSDSILQHRLKQSGDADVLICVSRNAAEIGLRYSRELTLTLPDTVIAAGKATAATLRAGGLTDVIQADSASNSETILALPQLRDVTGNNIHIWRGGEGRTLLGDTLRARGADVAFVDLYQRVVPAKLKQQMNQITAPEVDIVTITSVAGLENLAAALSGDIAVLAKKKLLVGSQRILKKAVERGFQVDNIIVAENPGDDEMLAALKSQLQKEGRLMTEDVENKSDAELGNPDVTAKEAVTEAELDSADELPAAEDAMAPEPLAKPVKRTGSRLGTILATLSFLLAATGIGGAYYFYEKEIKPALHASASADEVQQLNSRLQKQSTQLQNMDSQVEKTAEGVSALQTTVSADREPFILAQVEHLLEVANDRLTYMSDTDTASAALEDAMGRLDVLNQAGYASLRQAITADLQRVRSHQDVDANEVLSGLATLIADLRPLPSNVVLADEAVESGDELDETVPDSDTPKTIGGVWKRFTESVSSQVKVVKNDAPVSGMSATAINRYKLELLQLRLEAMRLSLIRDDMVSFNTELVEAQSWSIENLEPSLAQPILTELLRLRRLNFDVIPNLQNSLSEVRRAVAKSAAQVSNDGTENPEAEAFAPMRAPGKADLEIQQQKNRLPPAVDGCGGCSLPESVIEQGTAL